jgi:ubiquinone/menaquinone biosynthesis C-methylase UbiE
MMLPRVLEPEVMDSAEEARDYDAMDHSQVNRVFVADFLSFWSGNGIVLDLGTGTAQIPIELCRQQSSVQLVAVDLAEHMLQVAAENVRRAHLEKRIQLQRIDAKDLPWPKHCFAAVMSNSIVHHIPHPELILTEIVRVLAPGGALFIRDLVRPEDDAAVRHLVQTYAGQANAHQQKMFDDSLRAALTVAEIRAMVQKLGFDRDTVQQTTDRHWTWAATSI